MIMHCFFFLHSLINQPVKPHYTAQDTVGNSGADKITNRLFDQQRN